MQQSLKKVICGLGTVGLVCSSTVLYAASGSGKDGSGSGGGAAATTPNRLLVGAICNSGNNPVELQARQNNGELSVGAGVVDTDPEDPWKITITHQLFSNTTGGPVGPVEKLVDGDVTPALYDPSEAEWLQDVIDPVALSPDNRTHKLGVIATNGGTSCIGTLYWTDPTGATTFGPTSDNPNSKPNRAPRFPTTQSTYTPGSNGNASVTLVADEILNTATPSANQFKVKVTTPAGVTTTRVAQSVEVLNGDTFDPPVFQGALHLENIGAIPAGSTVSVTYTRATFPVAGVPIADPEGLTTANFTRTNLPQQ